MYFIAGSGVLFAAFLIVCIGYRLLNRPGAGIDPEAFGMSEAISLVFTGLVAFGFAALIHGTISNYLPASLIELAVALAVLIGACKAASFGLNRVLPRQTERAEGATPPPANLPGRPGQESRPVRPVGLRARRAA